MKNIDCEIVSSVDEKKLEIILISSVPPNPTSSGEIVLYRHLSQAPKYKITVISESRKSSENKVISRILNRLSNTRLHNWLNDMKVIACGKSWDDSLKSRYPCHQNTIVLTVAHGDGCWAAHRYARKHKLPLVTIFHDWWPDIPYVHTIFRDTLRDRFKKLYQDSDLALCVSEEMKIALGSHDNSQVLYPIPGENLNQFRYKKFLDKQSAPIRVMYCGNLYHYACEIAKLLKVTKDSSTVSLQVRGKNPNWQPSFRQEMSERGLWLDFAPREQLYEGLRSADALLVVMSFDPKLRRRMETSFPSKLCEYAQLGKPIIVWGPDYCSAAQWARKGDWALCISKRNPNSVVATLEKLHKSSELRQYYAEKTREVAQNLFNPSSIQKQFLDAINGLI